MTGHEYCDCDSGSDLPRVCPADELFCDNIGEYVQGVPKKIRISVYEAGEGLRRGPGTKVGLVLQNSGFFLSNEYKNSSLLSKKQLR